MPCTRVGPATSPRPKAAPLSVHDVPAATRGSAGIDLVNQENMDITLPGEVLLMPSQIQGPLPEGMVGLVLPRSSASKQGLFVVPGVVDSDYGGVIHVQLWSHLPKQLFQGDAWVQLILVPYSLPAGGRNVPRTGAPPCVNVLLCKPYGRFAQHTQML
uniref:dUTPase-like domain-containing protein n=1 Tax=Terrapene triunguis TaxID=2587831 RepID=A0A674IUD2_9SAUR